MKGIVICGPTGVGKSEIAVMAAKKIGAEIISCDSMQVYKHLNIGTAKISKEEMAGVRHHMIDIVEPEKNYSVSEFSEEANRILNNLYDEKKNVILAGGTGLYINSVAKGLSSLPEGNEQLRDELGKLESGELYSRLMLLDGEAAAEIHMNNRKRVIRALEVCILTGRKFSVLSRENIKKNNYEFKWYGIEMDREKLYAGINRRVDKMIENGLIDEARGLYENNRSGVTAVQAIGYKELFAYFDGRMTYEKALYLIKQGSRNYAKRQFTWFRNQNNIEWINLDKMSRQEAAEMIVKSL